MLAHHRNGEVGTQAGLLPAFRLHDEQPRTHSLASQLQQQAERLQDRRVDDLGGLVQKRRADRGERFGGNGGFGAHWPASMILRTAATSSERSMVC